MGYFANGTEGTEYEMRYCEHCLHQKPDEGGCAVWLAHMLYNYGAGDGSKLADARHDVLDMLIPRQKDGIGNEQCAMFVRDAERDRDRQQPRLFEW